MNLNQLNIFYFAVKAKNLIAAAEQLFITQPAVTKGIQRLQEHYELKLIDCVGKNLVLTDAGEALFRIAENIFDMETHAEGSIRDFQQCNRGRIHIQASESFGDYYLPPFGAQRLDSGRPEGDRHAPVLAAEVDPLDKKFHDPRLLTWRQGAPQVAELRAEDEILSRYSHFANNVSL